RPDWPRQFAAGGRAAHERRRECSNRRAGDGRAVPQAGPGDDPDEPATVPGLSGGRDGEIFRFGAQVRHQIRLRNNLAAQLACAHTDPGTCVWIPEFRHCCCEVHIRLVRERAGLSEPPGPNGLTGARAMSIKRILLPIPGTVDQAGEIDMALSAAKALTAS